MQRVLYLQVLDYDRFSRNDPIGEVSIPLNKVDLTQMQTFWKDLKPCSDGSVRPHVWVPGSGGWRVGAGGSGPGPPGVSGGWWGRCSWAPDGADFPPWLSALVFGPGENCPSCDKEPGLCSGSGVPMATGGWHTELPDEGDSRGDRGDRWGWVSTPARQRVL